jgi:stage V sporulation protein D (sporulation-specific penicillin-binding protein)
VPGGSEVLLYFGEESEVRKVAVPNLIGMNRAQANDAAGALGLYILVSGNTSVAPSVTAVIQSIPPGTEVDTGTTIKVEFIDTKAAD